MSLTVKITVLKKLDPESPGWLFNQEMQSIMAGTVEIPARFRDDVIMNNFIQYHGALVQNALMSGVPQYEIRKTDDSVVTLLAFNDAASFEAYDQANLENDMFDEFVEARAALLNLLKVEMTVYPLKTVDIDYISDYDTQHFLDLVK